MQVLVNVAPPKPNRTLTEEERRHMLQNRSPSEGSEGSRYRLVISEDFSIRCTVPCYKTQTTSVACDNFCEQSGDISCDTNCLLENNTMDRICDNSDGMLDVPLDIIEAPLASPETLSDISSICTVSRNNSLNLSGSKPKSLNPGTPNLETIIQSPECKLKKNSENNNCVKTEVVVENTVDISQESTEHLSSYDRKKHQFKHSRDHMKIQNEVPSPVCELLEFAAYERHSPVDSECNQSEYSGPNEYLGPNLYNTGGYPGPNLCSTHLGDEDRLNVHSPLRGCLSGSHHCEKCRQNSTTNVTQCSTKDEKIIKCSQSESYLMNLSAKYVMRRSAEQRDITRLQDSSEVFNTISDGDNTKSSLSDSQQLIEIRCNRTQGGGNCVNGSNGTQESSNSLEDDSEQRLSSSHSDDVFDFPLQETDV